MAFDTLNIEGRGFGGARDLLNTSVPFGQLQTLETVIDPAKKLVSLVVDGKPQGTRPFTPGPLSIDELTVGARFYTNGPGAQQVRGFAPCDLVEVLIYNRVLTTEESQRVRAYLQKKHAELAKALPATLPRQAVTSGFFLTPMKDPPPVQMLVPGFTVKELPLDLTNINNLRYRPDGKLVAVAYNGDIWLLSDTNGDGFEDKAEKFWDNQGRLSATIGMAPTPPNYPKGNGVFVAGKGKVSLVVDTDGDDKADREIIVAEGWRGAFHQVDALSVALDKNGSVYFGIGTPNFANGHEVDKDGKSQFNLKDPRGTIQKVSPDFTKRETVCTGIRFSVGLAFNRHGDLFATDQEGATWLPNGNPLDELLHIEPNRHYGFPPRHPKHLPDVIDEPSVMDYGPQHQSTCGLVFNEPVNGGPVFGPASWAGNAIVCGESRGKLYRTELLKTSHGYIGRNHLIACLQMLTVDACVSPKGDLVVACHSGPPDWGTGPTGKGKLFKISYTDRDQPQPVFAYPSSPQEVRIAFDRPLEPSQLQGLARELKITYGEYVRAGDRFETLKPPYQIVQNQTRTPRHELPVLGVQMTPDRRTLLIQTGPQTAAVHYSIQLPNAEFDYTLTGLQASFEGKTGERWSGWLPHLDPAVAREFTKGSAEHDRLWKLVDQGGKLKFDSQLKLDHMLQPLIQPGAKLDYERPPEKVRLSFGLIPKVRVSPSVVEIRNDDPKLVPLTHDVTEANAQTVDALTWSTDEDQRQRPMPLHRFLVPWAKAAKNLGEVAARPEIPEMKGGSWGRGRKVFFSEEALCAKCHVMHGQGGLVGPDLSNLVHRDYASVLRDLLEPSFAINPDFVSYTLALHDGRTLTGPVRTQDGKLLVSDEKGAITTLEPKDVDRKQPASKSIMPDDLAKKLGPDKLRDLLAYLLTDPPRMPVLA
jgi:putative heme-binding domain-containing protein